MPEYRKKRHFFSVFFKAFFLCCTLLLLTACNQSSETPSAAAFIYVGDTQSNPDLGIYNYEPLEVLLTQAIQSWQEKQQELGAQSSATSAEGVNSSKDEEGAEVLVVIGGDLVNNDADEKEWQAFFAAVKNAEQKTNCQVQIMPVAGNHTAGDGLYKQQFVLPENGPAGWEELFYSFDAGPVHFLMLDSNYMGSLDQQVVEQLQDFMKQDLGASQQPWKLAVLHHPFYPVGGNAKDIMRSETMQKNYGLIMEEKGIDLILCGHQHVYARTDALQVDEKTEQLVSKEDGIVQVMGVAGNKYYDAGDFTYLEKCVEDTSVYSLIICDLQTLQIETRDENGKLIDSFAKNKQSL